MWPILIFVCRKLKLNRAHLSTDLLFLTCCYSKINFSELYISLDGVDYPTLADAKAVSAPVFAYGSFIQNVIQFLILAFVVFLFMKVINKLKKPAPVATPTTKVCPYCKSEIHIDAVKCPHCASDLEDTEQ